jgi:hypothetical protein
MQRRTLSVIVIVGLVAVAGCNAFSGSSPETPMVTPMDVPTDEPTLIPNTPHPPLPPGVSEIGIKNGETLVRAHGAILEETSYAFHRVYTVRYANGTLRARVATDVWTATNRSHFYYVHNLSGSAARVPAGTNKKVAAKGDRVRVAIYADGVRMLRAITRNNSTMYGIVRNDIGAPFSPEYAELPSISGLSREDQFELSYVFRSVSEATVERVTSDTSTNTTRYRIRATRIAPDRLEVTTSLRAIRNASFSAVVDSRGVIHRYRLEYTGEINDTTVRVTESVVFTHIGSTTIERPPWYDEAIAVTNATTNRTTTTTQQTINTAFQFVDEQRRRNPLIRPTKLTL